MLSASGRKPAAVFIEPIARVFLRLGLTPNQVTRLGALASVVVAVVAIPTNHLFLAAIISGLFAAFDMVDGTMARMYGGGTKFGATLDATCDRITDGALFAAITYWLMVEYDASLPLIAASFTVLVASQVISYVKARGEASGFKINGGLVERPERLIIGLVGLGLQGLGVPYAIDVAIWVLAIGSIYTVAQRLRIAANDPRANEVIAPPKGAVDPNRKRK